MKTVFSLSMVIIFSMYSSNVMAALCTAGGIDRSSTEIHSLSQILLKANVDASCGYLDTPYDVDGLAAHAGIDFPRPKGTPVYSATSGEVVNTNTSVGHVAVRLSDNRLVNYYHMDTITVGRGQVSSGDQIGTVGTKGNSTGDHLHIEVRTADYEGTAAIGGASSGDSGRCTTQEIINRTHNPISLITVTQPVDQGVFDGAGSLISPSDNCFGCNKDTATMHPHPGTGSAVVFQSYRDVNKCTSVDITSEQEITAVIKSKSWSSHLTQETFEANLIPGQRVSLSTPAQWTTFAITSKDSIPYANNINAYCTSSSDIFYDGGRKSLSNDLVGVTNDYFWTGTGSIISSGVNSRSGFGVDKDIAVTFSTKNSLTSFQWRASDNCKNIEISEYNNSSVNASVEYKGWSESNDYFIQQCTSLPCTIAAPYNGYFVLKIKGGSGYAPSGNIKATCI